MVDPATAAGLSLAIVPLIISALENYEHTFRVFIIFARKYEKEVRAFQDALRVQKTDFDNQCLFLLESVSSHGHDLIVSDPLRWSRNEQELEDRLKALLEQNYDACVSALRLIDGVLTDILEQTKTLDILLQQVWKTFSLHSYGFPPRPLVKRMWKECQVPEAGTREAVEALIHLLGMLSSCLRIKTSPSTFLQGPVLS